MSHTPGGPARSARRLSPLVVIIVAGLVGALAMALTMTNTFSAFVATVTNTNDTAASGSVVLREASANGATSCSSTDSTTISSNSSTCSTINKYGGSTTMTPSDAAGTSNTVVTTVMFRNTGSVEASSFTLGVGACTQGRNGTVNGTATDLCSKLRGTISSGSMVLGSASLADAARFTFPLPPSMIPAAHGATTVPITFTIWLDSSADNSYQGLSASQPITWTLSS